MKIAAKSLHLCVAAFLTSAPPMFKSAEAAAGTGSFCNLTEVHPEAIRMVTHGVDLRIFPNAQKIDATFSGCQNVWLSNGFLLARAAYRNGVVISYVGIDPDGSRTVSCLYESHRLAAAAGECPPFEAFPLSKSGQAR